MLCFTRGELHTSPEGNYIPHRRLYFGVFPLAPECLFTSRRIVVKNVMCAVAVATAATFAVVGISTDANAAKKRIAPTHERRPSVNGAPLRCALEFTG